MKTIPYVAPIRLTDAMGDPWPDAEKAKKPFTQLEFLLSLTTDQGFAAPRKGVEQIEFTLAVREALRNTTDGSAYELEDEHHAALLRRLNETDFQQSIVHNFLAMAKALTG